LNNEQSVFSFELNESLFFEKGQEVAEIKGVSLDPDISIQSFEDYISIRGVVELKGEYEKLSLPSNHDDSISLEDYHQAKRYIEEVVDMSGDVSEFNHRFPVEISVPTYRVNNLEDVTVRIAFFDYELPEPGQFNLMSTIEIHGINDGDLEEERQEYDMSHSTDEESNQEEVLDETFEFELKKRKESEEVDEEEIIIEETLVENAVEEVKRQEAEQQVETHPEEEAQEKPLEHKKDEAGSEGPRWKKEHSQTLAEFFNQDASIESSSSEDITVSSEVDESSTLMESSSSGDKTDLRYLTGMFRDEEENYTQMRLCIVQENDTLESIAERYETTSMHIAKQNRLADDAISQGELLYIPYKKK